MLSKDPWIPILTVLVITLAVVLGWMLGRRGWGALRHADSPLAASKVEAAPSQNETPAPIVEPHPANATPPSGKETPRPPDIAPGGLMVYEKGKLIFQEKPVPPGAQTSPVQIPSSAAESLTLERVEPEYPPPSRLARIQGPVVLEVVVDESGSVQGLRIVSGNPELAGAAVEAVRQWRFKPYAPAGKALRFQTQITVAFKLP